MTTTLTNTADAGQTVISGAQLPVVAPDAVLCADGHATYERVANDERIPHFESVGTLMPSSLANWPSGTSFGGSIFAGTAVFRFVECANSSPCPARLSIQVQNKSLRQLP